MIYYKGGPWIKLNDALGLKIENIRYDQNDNYCIVEFENNQAACICSGRDYITIENQYANKTGAILDYLVAHDERKKQNVKNQAANISMLGICQDETSSGGSCANAAYDPVANATR